ncbi:hypothetical protein CHUAL_012284 [Chamberlinius hualienensis]
MIFSAILMLVVTFIVKYEFVLSASSSGRPTNSTSEYFFKKTNETFANGMENSKSLTTKIRFNLKTIDVNDTNWVPATRPTTFEVFGENLTLRSNFETKTEMWLYVADLMSNLVNKSLKRPIIADGENSMKILARYYDVKREPVESLRRPNLQITEPTNWFQTSQSSFQLTTPFEDLLKGKEVSSITEGSSKESLATTTPIALPSRDISEMVNPMNNETESFLNNATEAMLLDIRQKFGMLEEVLAVRSSDYNVTNEDNEWSGESVDDSESDQSELNDVEKSLARSNLQNLTILEQWLYNYTKFIQPQRSNSAFEKKEGRIQNSTIGSDPSTNDDKLPSVNYTEKSASAAAIDHHGQIQQIASKVSKDLKTTQGRLGSLTAAVGYNSTWVNSSVVNSLSGLSKISSISTILNYTIVKLDDLTNRSFKNSSTNESGLNHDDLQNDHAPFIEALYDIYKIASLFDQDDNNSELQSRMLQQSLYYNWTKDYGTLNESAKESLLANLTNGARARSMVFVTTHLGNPEDLLQKVADKIASETEKIHKEVETFLTENRDEILFKTKIISDNFTYNFSDKNSTNAKTAFDELTELEIQMEKDVEEALNETLAEGRSAGLSRSGMDSLLKQFQKWMSGAFVDLCESNYTDEQCSVLVHAVNASLEFLNNSVASLLNNREVAVTSSPDEPKAKSVPLLDFDADLSLKNESNYFGQLATSYKGSNHTDDAYNQKWSVQSRSSNVTFEKMENGQKKAMRTNDDVNESVNVTELGRQREPLKELTDVINENSTIRQQSRQNESTEKRPNITDLSDKGLPFFPWLNFGTTPNSSNTTSSTTPTTTSTTPTTTTIGPQAADVENATSTSVPTTESTLAPTTENKSLETATSDPITESTLAPIAENASLETTTAENASLETTTAENASLETTTATSVPTTEFTLGTTTVNKSLDNNSSLEISTPLSTLPNIEITEEPGTSTQKNYYSKDLKPYQQKHSSTSYNGGHDYGSDFIPVFGSVSINHTIDENDYLYGHNHQYHYGSTGNHGVKLPHMKHVRLCFYTSDCIGRLNEVCVKTYLINYCDCPYHTRRNSYTKVCETHRFHYEEYVTRNKNPRS